jgi:hypothetical protein
VNGARAQRGDRGWFRAFDSLVLENCTETDKVRSARRGTTRVASRAERERERDHFRPFNVRRRSHSRHSGQPEFNCRRPEFNSGASEFNSGQPELNSGGADFNSGLPELNSASAEFDSGLPEFDSREAGFNSDASGFNFGEAELNPRVGELDSHEAGFNSRGVEFDFRRPGFDQGACRFTSIESDRSRGECACERSQPDADWIESRGARTSIGAVGSNTERPGVRPAAGRARKRRLLWCGANAGRSVSNPTTLAIHSSVPSPAGGAACEGRAR